MSKVSFTNVEKLVSSKLRSFLEGVLGLNIRRSSIHYDPQDILFKDDCDEIQKLRNRISRRLRDSSRYTTLFSTISSISDSVRTGVDDIGQIIGETELPYSIREFEEGMVNSIDAAIIRLVADRLKKIKLGIEELIELHKSIPSKIAEAKVENKSPETLYKEIDVDNKIEKVREKIKNERTKLLGLEQEINLKIIDLETKKEKQTILR